MIKSVVSKEYQELQKEIVKFQEQWKLQLDPETIRPNLDKAAMEAGVPAAALAVIDFEISLFLQWVEEINAILTTYNPELETKLAAITSLLTEETAIRWVEEGFSVNDVYFTHFAE